MARRLVEGVWLLELGLVPPLASNAYLVDRGDVTLVDAGLPVNAPRLRSELASAGSRPADVDRVLVTHYDLDHTGGLARIADDLRAPVYIGAADARVLAGEDDPDALHHKGAFHRVARRLAPLPEGLAVRRVADGDRIGAFTAYHTPGHNPGHTVYVTDEVAFLGDLVWEENGELTPPFWLDSYDMGRVRESIRDFAGRVSLFEVACMAHGTPIVGGGSDALARLVGRL